MKTKTHSAFTLIELLMVVAIIAVLAAIAVPNFLEAMTRSKVSRAASDLRTVATSLETYAIDNNAYPEPLERLSSPIAYIADAYSPDVFANPEGWFALGYVQGHAGSQQQFLEDWKVMASTPPERAAMASHRFFVFSNGPDLLDEAIESPTESFKDVIRAPGARLGYFYDPTNGTISRGDILRTSKGQPLTPR